MLDRALEGMQYRSNSQLVQSYMFVLASCGRRMCALWPGCKTNVVQYLHNRDDEDKTYMTLEWSKLDYSNYAVSIYAVADLEI